MANAMAAASSPWDVALGGETDDDYDQRGENRSAPQNASSAAGNWFLDTAVAAVALLIGEHGFEEIAPGNQATACQ